MDEDRLAQALDDFRETLRQLNLRSERVMRELVQEISEQRAEIRAQTQAILKMLDRWGDNPTPAS